MKIFDISLAISPDMPFWPGDPPVVLEQVSSINKGEQANVSSLKTGVHVGTHVDAPHHFLNNNQTVEHLPLNILIGPALVVYIPDDIEIVTDNVLAKCKIAKGIERLLLRTKNSKLWEQGERKFHPNYVSISEDGAEWLVEHGVKLIGVDYLSVAPYAQGVTTHQILLQASIVIVEGLDLSRVPKGKYELYCLPLKILDADGAPARVILIRHSPTNKYIKFWKSL